MSARSCDIALVGAGLAGGLIALAVARARPGFSIRLIDSGPAVGGNHRWSWFASDVSETGAALLDAIPQARWDDGYDVRFPAYDRHLPTPYRSIASADFAAALDDMLPAGTILTGRAVTVLDAGSVTLADGVRLTAATVIDCRGFVPTGRTYGGWQVFLGRHLRLTHPHGLARPVIMDATVEQRGGYRFIYILPLGERELFLEDTCYQDSPVLDEETLSARLDAYARSHGWEGAVVGSETGVLPVVTGGDFRRWQNDLRVEGVGRAGARAGFVHPLTSYTLPFAVETALAIAGQADLRGRDMAAMLEQRAMRHWQAMQFYRMLGAMLFSAPAGRERYRVFQRFYRLPAPLIARFYAGQSSWGDKARILCGRPPVPIGGALRTLIRRNGI